MNTTSRVTIAVALFGLAIAHTHAVSAGSANYSARAHIKYTDKATQVTVNVARRATDTKGAGYFHPPKGKEWEFFYVQIRNSGSKAVDYNPFDFHLIDQKGQQWDVGFVIDDKFSPELHSGKLPPHQLRAGWVPFEIPASTHSATLMWDKPNAFDDQATIGHYRLP